MNNAFGTAHRAHASTEGVTKYLSPSVSGFLLAKELDGTIESGKRPMATFVGGSKESSKILFLNALLDKCDKIIIGGGMVFTFLTQSPGIWCRKLPHGRRLRGDHLRGFGQCRKSRKANYSSLGCHYCGCQHQNRIR